MYEVVKIGVVSVSDRASRGDYVDEGIPAVRSWLMEALYNPIDWVQQLIPDEQPLIEQTLKQLVDEAGCSLVLTTGGTGPAPRDTTPEATLAVAQRVLPGFGEQMRQVSLHYVPTAILSRQLGVIRAQCLILNLPGRPASIRETLQGVMQEGTIVVPGVFAAVPYCLDLIGGPALKTRPEIVNAYRPAR